jgi:superfamily I DNA/RNA helicase
MSFEPTLQQRRAIEAPLGPVLVVAGPGAGKTQCLIRRIQHIIEHFGILPRRICAVTFTNRAAEEIAIRLKTELGNSAEEVTRGTLHALCRAILREYPERVGLRSGFGVADEDYQCRLLRQLRVAKKWQTHLLHLFARHRLGGCLLGTEDQKLFEAYVTSLRRRNLVDFDDLVALTETLLRDDQSIAAELSSRWDYVLVDEFQDLNFSQYAVVRCLANHRNLFAVGDDEQSIYSWTGADPKILRRLREDFGLTEIVLDYNHRCSTQIFTAARDLIRWNPPLFEKNIEALSDSEFEVEVRSFEDEIAEANWVIRDMCADRAADNRSWGDYAVLYRKHELGLPMEARLVQEGIPCRVAKGHALMDDEVIAYVVSSLQVILAPDDPLVMDSLAERVLPAQLLQEVAAASISCTDLLGRLRVFVRRLVRGHRNRTKIWRLIYHIENLRAVARSSDSLAVLVNELLSQRVGPSRNPLEERHHDLTDPAAYPGAAALADRISAVAASGGHLLIKRDRGVEIALRGMLLGADVVNVQWLAPDDRPSNRDLVLRQEDVRYGRLPLLVFKAVQLLHSRNSPSELTDFTAFDLETTDRNVRSCEIVEIAAVKVRNRQVVERFRSLVSCRCPISPEAQAKHGYCAADLRGAPSFSEVWPRFRDFVGHDLLIAHNGQKFDVPVLRRLAEDLGGIADLVFYDSVPLAESLIDESLKLSDLACRFNVQEGSAHHALDDSLMLAAVVPKLITLKNIRDRKSAMLHVLDYLGLALALDNFGPLDSETDLLRDLSTLYTLGRYSDCLEAYAAELAAGTQGAPTLEAVIDRLGGVALMEQLRGERTPDERYPTAVARLRVLVEASSGGTLDEQIQDMLCKVALSSSGGVETDPDRVNLLTLHSTKGLEFSRVYIIGVENAQLPGRALEKNQEDEIQEARRLLYVGMTRAEDRLVLTRTDRRGGEPSGGSLFLTQAGLQAAIHGTPPAMEPEAVPK